MKKNEWLEHLCSSQDDGCHGWEAKLIGEVPILGCVIERLWLIIRIPSMIIQVLPWRMYQMLWWKCTTSAEGRNYSNSRVRGHGRLDGHTVPSSDVLKMKVDLNCDFDLTTAELWTWHLGSHLSNLDN